MKTILLKNKSTKYKKKKFIKQINRIENICKINFNRIKNSKN